MFSEWYKSFTLIYFSKAWLELGLQKKEDVEVGEVAKALALLADCRVLSTLLSRTGICWEECRSKPAHHRNSMAAPHGPSRGRTSQQVSLQGGFVAVQSECASLNVSSMGLNSTAPHCKIPYFFTRVHPFKTSLQICLLSSLTFRGSERTFRGHRLDHGLALCFLEPRGQGASLDTSNNCRRQMVSYTSLVMDRNGID